MSIPASLVRFVRSRANRCCEYCHLFDGDHPIEYEIDHIIPICHGGKTERDNLAYSCWTCNSFKGPNLAGIDPSHIVLFGCFIPDATGGPTTFRGMEQN